MRAAATLKPLAVLAFVLFAGLAYLHPAALAGLHARASQGPLWLALSLLAAGCTAKMVVPVSLFGLRCELSAPLLLALAAPFFIRFLLLDRRARARALTPSPPPRRPPPPYAMPPRVATALIAAARARK